MDLLFFQLLFSNAITLIITFLQSLCDPPCADNQTCHPDNGGHSCFCIDPGFTGDACAEGCKTSQFLLVIVALVAYLTLPLKAC